MQAADFIIYYYYHFQDFDKLRAWENSYLCREEKEQVGRGPSEVALQRASASDVPVSQPGTIPHFVLSF